MNTVHNYTGTKICEKCLNHALTSYIFINKIRYIRSRLNTCVSLMLESLNRIDEPQNNVMVEIAMETILPIMGKDVTEDYIKDDEEVDESQLKVEILEDEFRIETESSEEEENVNFDDTDEEVNGEVAFDDLKKMLYPVNNVESDNLVDTDAEEIKQDYNEKLVNGYPMDTLKEAISPNVSDAKRSPTVSDVDKSATVCDDERPPAVSDAEKSPTKSDADKSPLVSDAIYIPVSDICSEFLTFKKKSKPKRKNRANFTCPFCSKRFVSDYFLKNHVLKHVNTKINCSLCSEPLKSKFHLFEHMKMVHIAHHQEYSTCETCGRGFADNNKFLMHKKTHTTKECPLCDKSFTSQRSYDSHFQRHAVKFNGRKVSRSQTCSFCEKDFSNENQLSLHVNKSHLQIKPYNCDMCDKNFYTEYNLSSHKRLHDLRSKETCEFCSKVFKCRRDLVSHVRKHIGTKPHHCHICRESFYSETSQLNHMKRVHGGRFCCRLCKSVFNRKVDLRAHVNVAHNAM